MPLRESVVNLAQIAQSNDQSQLIKAVIPNGSHGIRIESYIQKGLTID